MKKSSGSIQATLQWGFTLGATLVLTVAAVALYLILGHHQQRQAHVRVRQIAATFLPCVGREIPPTASGYAWILLGPSGELRQQSAVAGELPLGLSWPTVQSDPITQVVDGRLLTTLVAPWMGPSGSGQLRLALEHTEDLTLQRETLWILALAVIGAGLLAGGVGRLLAKRSLAPLSNITRETGSIDYRHLEVRLQELDFPQEFGPLVLTLNASLGRLQIAFDRLGRLGAELAHELRTPLQNLRVGLEALILRPRDLDATRDGIGAALEEVARLASLIDQVLLLARSEHPGAAISARELDLPVLLEAISEPFCLTAEDKQVEIRVQVAPGLRLIADEVLVRRAVSNLLANALRHAPVGGWIIVGGFMSSREIRIWVEDNGPGIPATWVNRAGTPFERGPSAIGSDGFGLGLAIVKGIMNLHGGRMVLESTVGHGTKVSLSFPKPG